MGLVVAVASAAPDKAPENKCPKAPTVSLTVSPTRAKKGKKNSTKTLTLGGSISQPQGVCSVKGASVEIVDEFGLFHGAGTVRVSGTTITGSIPDVPTDNMRLDKEHDGRTYTITVTVENGAGKGAGTATFTVVKKL